MACVCLTTMFTSQGSQQEMNVLMLIGIERTGTAEYLILNIYKILPCEPLHHVKGHMNNLYEEIPYHTHNKNVPDKASDPLIT